MGRVIGFLFKALGVCTFLGLVLGVAGLYFAGQWLTAGDEPAPCDAMVVLSGRLSRAEYAADLYNQGYADTVYVARPVLANDTRKLRELGYDVPTDEEAHAAVLASKGVPAEAIVLYGDSIISTVEEAEALREILGREPVKLLVVTSPFHVRRAKLIFADVFPEAEILVCGSTYEAFPEKWWTKQSSALAVIMETAKTVFYLLGGGFRSTDVAESGPSPATLPETP